MNDMMTAPQACNAAARPRHATRAARIIRAQRARRRAARLELQPELSRQGRCGTAAVLAYRCTASPGVYCLSRLSSTQLSCSVVAVYTRPPSCGAACAYSCGRAYLRGADTSCDGTAAPRSVRGTHEEHAVGVHGVTSITPAPRLYCLLPSTPLPSTPTDAHTHTNPSGLSTDLHTRTRAHRHPVPPSSAAHKNTGRPCQHTSTLTPSDPP